MTAFLLEPTRSGQVPRDFFPKGTEGIVNVDRYAGYFALLGPDWRIKLAYCWSHQRRDFVNWGEGSPRWALWAGEWVGVMNQLFATNRQRRKAWFQGQTQQFNALDQEVRRQVQQIKERSDSELACACFTILATLRQHEICPRRYCGREFSAAELAHIRELLQIKPILGRVAFSRRVCQDLGWLNGLGQPKEMSCRVALLRLDPARTNSGAGQTGEAPLPNPSTQGNLGLRPAPGLSGNPLRHILNPPPQPGLPNVHTGSQGRTATSLWSEGTCRQPGARLGCLRPVF